MIGTIREPVPGGTSGKEPVCQCKIRQRLELRFSPWGREDPREEGMATHSSIIFLENPHGQRSLVGYSPWGHKRIRHDQSDLTCTHQGAGSDRGNGPPPNIYGTGARDRQARQTTLSKKSSLALHTIPASECLSLPDG